jgi:hypothetical protein
MLTKENSNLRDKELEMSNTNEDLTMLTYMNNVGILNESKQQSLPHPY